MRFSPPLLPGHLVKRYKRFLADITLDSGETITAHCANPGALLGGTTPGLRVWVSHNPSPTRKLSYSWQLVEMEDTLVGVNTSLPNPLAEEAILNGDIAELCGYDFLKREVKYGTNSRIDMLLTSPNKPPCYVEVKNVHLKRGQSAAFPDSVTTRGAKHLRELETIAAQGSRAVMLYIIQRNDCTDFQFAADIDPVYAKTAEQALSKGVEAYAYLCSVSVNEIEVSRKISVIL
ncbi:MAG: DNA/RNA nuclease SfsA [Alphaproteobacteria bacterium]|jgi:sugar fermentation stimulation protein A|nr:DNA/RNA nuclease SfsA [Alphaproteobacteria bacterium]